MRLMRPRELDGPNEFEGEVWPHGLYICVFMIFKLLLYSVHNVLYYFYLYHYIK